MKRLSLTFMLVLALAGPVRAEDQVQIRYTIGDFSDALYFPKSAVPSPAEIEKIKQARYAAWLAAIKEASSRPAPAPQPDTDEPQ